MADRGTIEELKQEIDEYIYTNGRQEITGEILNDVLNDIVDTLAEHSGGGNVAWGTVSGATQNLNVDDDVRPLLRPQTGVSGFLNADGTVDTTHYLSEEDAEDTYQPIIDASHKLAYSLISDTPTALPNPFALTFGSKTYDGSAAKEITASDLGALTSHQTIYSLVLKVNGTQVGSYTPNSAAETINITDVASANDVLTLKGYFTNGKANDADKLDGNDSSHYATANSVTTIAGYFTDGSAKTAVKLLTSRTLWGQSFDGSANVSGDMSSVGKITFTAKTSASSSGNVLEVVTINGTTYLHSVLPFYSDHAITAGGIGSGGGGGGLITTLYRTADFGKTIASGNDTFDGNAINSLYFRIVALENRPQGGVTSFNSRTGAITLSSSDVTTALGYIPVNKAGDTMLGPLSINTTLQAPLTINRKGGGGYVGIAYYYSDNALLGYIGIYNNIGPSYSPDYVSFYKIYHEGNLTKSTLGLGNVENKSSATIRGELTASNVTTALGNTAVAKATDADTLDGQHASYFATASSLGNYLPLTGGTLSGILSLNYTGSWAGAYPSRIEWKNACVRAGGGGRIDEFFKALKADGTTNFAFGHYGDDATDAYLYIGYNEYNGNNLRVSPSGVSFGGNTIYHSGNLTAATLGAETTAHAAATYLPLSGGNVTSSYPVGFDYYNGSTRLATLRYNNDLNVTGLMLVNRVNSKFLVVGDSASNNELTYGNVNGRHIVYHSGNSNNTSTEWSCSNLYSTDNGIAIGGGSQILFSEVGRGALCAIKSRYDAIDWAQPTYMTSGSLLFMTQKLGIGLREHMRITADGNVLIGTTTDYGQKLYVAGNIVATGAVTAGQASDSHFKSNVKAYTNAMFKIMSLRPVEFDWNDLAHSFNSENEGHSFGLIAQEVQSVIPEVVTPIYEKYLRVDYGKLSTLCIAGIQDHEREIRQLKYKVAELENRIHQLTS